MYYRSGSRNYTQLRDFRAPHNATALHSAARASALHAGLQIAIATPALQTRASAQQGLCPHTVVNSPTRWQRTPMTPHIVLSLREPVHICSASATNAMTNIDAPRRLASACKGRRCVQCHRAEVSSNGHEPLCSGSSTSNSFIGYLSASQREA